MSSNTLGARNSQNMHPFELSLGGHLFLEHHTPQALPYILCWVTNYAPGQEHYQKQFPAQLWLHGGCPGSGNALDVWALQYT